MEYSVAPYLERLIDVPTLMVVAEGDDHTMWELEVDAFNRILTPKKRLFVVPKSGHHSLYRDDELIEIAVRECTEWFTAHLLDDEGGTGPCSMSTVATTSARAASPSSTRASGT